MRFIIFCNFVVIIITIFISLNITKMKKIKVMFTAFIAVVMLSLGFTYEASAQGGLSSILNVFSGAASATSSGQSAGAALNALYKQYKADGKLNLSNITTLANATTLATSIQGLKGKKITSTYCKDFAKGLVTGSSSTITPNESTSVTSALSKLADGSALTKLLSSPAVSQTTSAVSNAATTATSKIENATEIANSITNVLKLLK